MLKKLFIFSLFAAVTYGFIKKINKNNKQENTEKNLETKTDEEFIIDECRICVN